MQKKTKVLISSLILGCTALTCIAPVVSCTSTIDNETFTSNANGIIIKNDLVFTKQQLNGVNLGTQTLNASTPITVIITPTLYKLEFNINVRYVLILNNQANVSEPVQSINDLPNIYTRQRLLPVIINNQTYIIYLTK